MDGILTQWDFHRVQEHSNQSSDEEVMTFRSWRSHKTRQPYPDILPDLPKCPSLSSSRTHFPIQNSAGILTQLDFHRVQEHLNRSSDEEVMTLRSWRSHMTRQPYPDDLPDLPECPFQEISNTQCPPKEFSCNLDAMGFP